VMLYASSDDSDELHELQTLLDESPHIIFDEVRDTLAKNGRAGLLARIYERRGNKPALIDLYIKVAEGVLVDPSITNPVGEVAALLRGSQDRKLVRQHALWLLKRDVENGLKVRINHLLSISFWPWTYSLYSYSSPVYPSNHNLNPKTPNFFHRLLRSTPTLDYSFSNILYSRNRHKMEPCIHG
jgi:hypothetical protein